MERLKVGCKLLFLFLVGGLVYVAVELAWRGRSHPSMFALGGICFVLIGLINEVIPWEMGFLWQALIGAGIVTALEFVTGLIVNIWLGWGVWNYDNMPLNILGQICLPFSMLWIVIAGAAILLDDWIRWRFFGEEKPHYKFI